ncbi:MAG TPA: TIGR04076 family protein [Thermofilum sp.]|nr:TIGR04076 family protein [Thermofilum sp.]
MSLYEVEIKVKEVKGYCPIYKPGDVIVLKGFYVDTERSAPICMHAFLALCPLLSAFSHGTDARALGIGSEPDKGYLQCPDPGPPHTRGGTVLFELIRKGKIDI